MVGSVSGQDVGRMGMQMEHTRLSHDVPVDWILWDRAFVYVECDDQPLFVVYHSAHHRMQGHTQTGWRQLQSTARAWRCRCSRRLRRVWGAWQLLGGVLSVLYGCK